MLKELIESFSPQFYKKIAYQSLRKSIFFLILFIVIISAIISFKATIIIKKRLPVAISWIEKNLKDLASDLPEIEIKKGEVVSPTTTYIKKWDNNFVFVIEPTKEKRGFFLHQYPNAGVLAKKQFFLKISKPGGADIKSYNLTNVNYLKVSPTLKGIEVITQNRSFFITSESVRNFSKKISPFLYPLVFFYFLSWYGMNKPLHILIFSLISSLINNNLKAPLNYRELLNVGVYAIVPPTFLGLANDLIGVKIPLFWFFYSLIYTWFIFKAIKVIKEG